MLLRKILFETKLEAAKSRNYEEKVENYVEDLFDNDEQEKKEEMLKHAFEQTYRLQQKNLDTIIKPAIAALGEEWNGSNVTLTPSFQANYEYGGDTFPTSPMNDSLVHIHDGNFGEDSDLPYFSMFVFEEEGDRVSVDDVLDAGDRDFFKSKEVEMDYFNLIDAIRGSAKRKNKEKVITLYTARPVAHRNQLQSLADKKLIPNNIFLTTSESEAEGYSIDLASEEKRDLWIVKIRQKYLTQTLDSPSGVKNYQTFSREEYVPVVEMWRISG